MRLRIMHTVRCWFGISLLTKETTKVFILKWTWIVNLAIAFLPFLCTIKDYFTPAVLVLTYHQWRAKCMHFTRISFFYYMYVHMFVLYICIIITRARTCVRVYLCNRETHIYEAPVTKNQLYLHGVQIKNYHAISIIWTDFDVIFE